MFISYRFGGGRSLFLGSYIYFCPAHGAVACMCFNLWPLYSRYTVIYCDMTWFLKGKCTFHSFTANISHHFTMKYRCNNSYTNNLISYFKVVLVNHRISIIYKNPFDYSEASGIHSEGGGGVNIFCHIYLWGV